MEQELEGHSDWVRDVAWAPSIGLPSQTLASCSQDQKVVIWTSDDLAMDSTAKYTFRNTQVLSFNAPVWSLSWSVSGNILAVASGDNKVTLWKQMPTGQWQTVSSAEEGQPFQLGAAAGQAPGNGFGDSGMQQQVVQ